MSNIKVMIAGRDIKVADGYEKPSAGDVNTCAVSLAIESGGVWDSLPNKRVTFSTRTASVTVDYAPTITIPHEVMAYPGALYITLTGYDANGVEVARTHRMTYPIEVARAGADEGAEPTPATLDVVSRIDNLASTLEQSETTRQEAFESAQNERSDAFQASMSEWQQDVAESVSHASNAATLANEAATNANNAATNANEAAESANKAAEDMRAAAERGDFDGAPGEPGADGYSPTANVTKVGGTATITVADKNGTTTATVSDGAPGKDGSDATATDVRINGTSITVDGVADIPAAVSNGTYGVVKLGDPNVYGIQINAAGFLSPSAALNIQIDEHAGWFQPIVPSNMDYAVKAAMCDGKGAAWAADEQKAARERMNAADANKVYIMQKQIENLQGIAATDETDSTEAYTKTVPTGAQKWASIDKVGGKTVVLNQHCNYIRTVGGNATETDEYVELNAVNTGNRVILKYDSIDYPVVSGGHKYLFMGMFSNVSNSSASIVQGYYGYGNPYTITNKVDHTGSGWGIVGAIVNIGQTGQGLFQFAITNTELPASYRYKKNSGVIIDLTQMFGSGNEPSTVDEFRAMFPADYYPYNPGELMSAEVVGVESKGTFPIPQSVRDMCPGYGWSAGTVCNEIDFERKVYVQRVGSVDMGTLDWIYTSSLFRVGLNIKPASTLDARKDGLICDKYQADKQISISFESMSDKAMLRYSDGTLFVKDEAYTDLVSFKAAMQGVTLYYELAEPIEVDLSSVLPDDHFIEVEAGGTVMFKQASTQLPVPSSVTYQISTSEVIANA